jgi:hypothetical protein
MTKDDVARLNLGRLMDAEDWLGVDAFLPPLCPSCLGRAVGKLDDGRYACYGCGTTWTQKRD